MTRHLDVRLEYLMRTLWWVAAAIALAMAHGRPTQPRLRKSAVTRRPP